MANASKRIFSSPNNRYGYIVGNLFNNRLKSLESKHIFNSQAKFHDSLSEKLFHPSIVHKIKIHETGDKNSFDWRIHFAKHQHDNDTKEHLSPWHDIPLGFNDAGSKKLLFNYVNEIPKGDRAKIECATKEMWNPMKQDVKKGALRFFKYGDLPFNYGFIPQTFEDPNLESQHSDVKGLKGDGDPVDVVEISNTPLTRGVVVPIKVLAVLGLIDEGETDWKIIGIRGDHPKAGNMHTINDACEILEKDFKSLILDWFENYKVPDGKPQNKFSHNKQYQSPDMGIDIIEECHHQWYNLLNQGSPTEKGYCLDSHALKHLVDEGVIGNKSFASQRTKQKVKYPELHWIKTDAGHTFAQKKPNQM